MSGGVSTLTELLAEAAQSYGDAPAVLRADGSQVSYARLERDAAAVARGLKDAGASTNSLVQVAVDDPALFPAAFYGVALAGCAAVLCSLPAGEKSPYLLDTPAVRAILSAGPFDGAALRAADGAFPAENPLFADASQGDRRIACIMGSSGTLGEPKAVMLTEEGLVADALAGLAGYPYPDGTRIVHLVPFEHAFGLTCGLNAALAAGATICVPENPAAFLARLPRFAPTALNLPPRAARLLLAAMEAADDPARVTGGALRKVLCGGAACEVETARGLEAFGVQVHGCYGLTECSPCVSVCAPGPFGPGDCGLPLACNQVGFSAAGEILVRGANVMAGYYGRPELTASVLVDGVLHTGDLGFLDERGCLHVEGRLDSALVLDDGRLLSPEVVERELCACPAIEEALVALGADGALTATLFVGPSDATSRADACDRARDHALGLVLEGGRRIERVEFSEGPLPRTALGKVVRPR